MKPVEAIQGDYIEAALRLNRREREIAESILMDVYGPNLHDAKESWSAHGKVVLHHHLAINRIIAGPVSYGF